MDLNCLKWRRISAHPILPEWGSCDIVDDRDHITKEFNCDFIERLTTIDHLFDHHFPESFCINPS